MHTNELLLLQLIDSNRDLSPLRKRGLTHSQIALLLEKLIDQGFISISDTDVQITECGKKSMEEFYSSQQYNWHRKWLNPQLEYYQIPLSENDIILPHKI